MTRSLLPLGIADFIADFILDLSGDVSRPSENFAAFVTPPMPAAVHEPAPARGEQQIAFAPRMEALRVVDVPGPKLCELSASGSR